jgi:glyceraldehyde-3-phosphate dehydrogenase (NAD(P))
VKRVADAASMQNDMTLMGVADITSDYKIRVAVERDYPVFASDQNKATEMKANGIPVRGSLDDLLSKVDVVIDCTPKKIGIKNKELYQARGIKAIWQEGEKHEVACCRITIIAIAL